MESMIYSASPLSEYLEGEGERDGNLTAPVEQPQTSPTQPSFAPRGLPTIRTSLRKNLPLPLRLQTPRTPGGFRKLHHACSSAVNSRIGRSENERFLEQFRYTIIASQLLAGESQTAYHRPTESVPKTNGEPDDAGTSTTATFNVVGAASTGAVSFLVVWTLHSLRGRNQSIVDWRFGCALLALVVTVASALYVHARRQRLKRLRQSAVETATSLVSNSQALELTASSAFTFIQEVEIVSRGYTISSPLPPISRLEEWSQSRRCSKLRQGLGSCLTSLLNQLAASFLVLLPLADEVDLERYYDIYEVSRRDIQEVELGLTAGETDDQESLRTLRGLLSKLYVWRKLVLCLLLALHADGGKPDFPKWSTAVAEMHALTALNAECSQKITALLEEEEKQPWGGSGMLVQSPGLKPLASSITAKSPMREGVKVQLRRMNSLSQGIRALHAKMHILREETETKIEKPKGDIELSSLIGQQYDLIGAELRSLLREWETGRSCMTLDVEKSEKRWSRSSSAMRSPLSPAYSLGGLTAVEDSPSDALRVLNGEDFGRTSLDAAASDEEIFEAVALPRQRISMTREEKMARMKQDRQKRATFHEKAEANTSMLRELETVIKLRPRGRTSSRITSI